MNKIMMESRRNIRNILALLVTLLLLLVACSDDKHGSSMPTGDTFMETNDNTIVSTDKQDKNGINPLRLKNYQYSTEQTKVDAMGNVTLLATLAIENEPDAEGEYLSNISIIKYDSEYILFEYEITDISADSEEDVALPLYEHHIVLFDTENYKTVRELVYNNDSYYRKNFENVISIEILEDNKWVVEVYDYQLNKIMTTELNISNLGKLSSDGKRYYYEHNNMLNVYDSELGNTVTLESYDEYLVEYIDSVITDGDGKDYVIFTGMAADYNEYQFIYDVGECQLIRVDDMEMRNNIQGIKSYIESSFGDMYVSSWLIGIAKDKAYEYNLKEMDKDVVLYELANGDIFFSYTDETKIYMNLYDVYTGVLKGSAVLETSTIKLESEIEMPEYEEDIYWLNQMFINNAPVYSNENELLIQLVDYVGAKYFIKWNIGVESEGMMDVVSHEIESIQAVDISTFDNVLYHPKPLSEELAELRIEADRLEEKYGVEIYIGEECGNVKGSYTICPLTDCENVEAALAQLDEEMNKYPDNFFEQFEYSSIEGLDIYIASELNGISDDTLDQAGGFKIVDNCRILLVMDCQTTQNIENTFHHELSHAIDEKIYDASWLMETPFFSEEQWNELNPYDDIYSYNYSQWGYDKYSDLAYENVYWDTGDVENVYFIDMYAMTYPTEDRARLFESVMSDYVYDIDFDDTPYLKEKLNYYAQCIRAAFDTTGWEDVPWESYMD